MRRADLTRSAPGDPVRCGMVKPTSSSEKRDVEIDRAWSSRPQYGKSERENWRDE